MVLTDQLGRTLEFAHPPRRIVSLVPSLTELLFDLGVGERVVGSTKFCARPPAEAQGHVARIGGTKRPRIDAILGLTPDLIIANREENRREDVEALAGAVPVYVSDIADPPGALEVVQALGIALRVEAQARELHRRLSDAYAALPDLAGRRIAYLIWQGPFMVVGGGTYIDAMLRACRAVNVFGASERYPEVEREELSGCGADELWLSSEPFPFRDRHLAELAQTFPTSALRLVDGEAFSWYGSRLLHARGVVCSVVGGSGSEPDPGAPDVNVLS